MHTVVINIRSVFCDSKKYHPQVILERCLCKLVEDLLSFKFRLYGSDNCFIDTILLVIMCLRS